MEGLIVFLPLFEILHVFPRASASAKCSNVESYGCWSFSTCDTTAPWVTLVTGAIQGAGDYLYSPSWLRNGLWDHLPPVVSNPVSPWRRGMLWVWNPRKVFRILPAEVISVIKKCFSSLLPLHLPKLLHKASTKEKKSIFHHTADWKGP